MNDAYLGRAETTGEREAREYRERWAEREEKARRLFSDLSKWPKGLELCNLPLVGWALHDYRWAESVGLCVKCGAVSHSYSTLGEMGEGGVAWKIVGYTKVGEDAYWAFLRGIVKQ